MLHTTAYFVFCNHQSVFINGSMIMSRIMPVYFPQKFAKMNSEYYFLILSALLASTYSQSIIIEDSLNSFGIDLLAETVNQAGDLLNVAVSPYTVWTLMTVISEGSRENTARQLESTLRLPPNKTTLRNSYLSLSSMLQEKSDGVTLEIDNAIFTNADFPVKMSFEDISKRYYDVTTNPTDFKNPAQAASDINKYVARATRNRLMNFVQTGDVAYAQVFLTSILYFKGLWNMPFNRSETRRESFYDEKNNKIGEVEMMYQIGSFAYSRLESLNSYALELPYGRDRKMSMIVILPFKGESISGVLNSISKSSFSSILTTLEKSFLRFSDEQVHVYLPRFKVDSDFNMNIVLSKIGIKDVFDIKRANLLDMFDQLLYLSRLIQKAEIEVDEEGTVATSAAGASFENKSRPPRFKANRPFLYFIVDKPTRSVVYAGKISNPNTIKNA